MDDGAQPPAAPLVCPFLPLPALLAGCHCITRCLLGVAQRHQRLRSACQVNAACTSGYSLGFYRHQGRDGFRLAAGRLRRHLLMGVAVALYIRGSAGWALTLETCLRHSLPGFRLNAHPPATIL